MKAGLFLKDMLASRKCSGTEFLGLQKLAWIVVDCIKEDDIGALRVWGGRISGWLEGLGVPSRGFPLYRAWVYIRSPGNGYRCLGFPVMGAENDSVGF